MSPVAAYVNRSLANPTHPPPPDVSVGVPPAPLRFNPHKSPRIFGTPPLYCFGVPDLFLVSQNFLYTSVMDMLLPDIEDDIPLPKKASEAFPDLLPNEELEMRVRTIKLLSDLTGEPVVPTAQHRIEAQDLAQQMMQNPKLRPDYNRYPNETMAYLAGMVAQTKCMLVDELSELKMYVINKLVHEIEHAQMPKDRIAALTKLGEIDGVDAFKRRSEITVQIKPIEEVEKELLSVLENIEYAVEPEIDPTPAQITFND